MRKQLASIICLMMSSYAFAASYSVPPSHESLIGEMRYTSVGETDTAATIAQRYDIGLNAIHNANPTINVKKRLTIGKLVQVPTMHLLPNQPRTGIVINLPEMRMYYYPAGTNEVLTYPIGIGKIGKTIPITNTSITKKVKNPVWIPPQDIREFNLQQGIVLPRIMPAGPDNPLGPYAIYMRLPTYLIHSTIFPDSIGTRASFGCIRMFESDIQEFFPSIQPGIPVVITNAPIKAGWEDNRLYLEAHTPLEEHNGAYDASLPGAIHLISSLTKDRPTLVDWQMISYINQERDGIPHNIGVEIR